jgi:NAD(P)H-hydrate epimerase
MIPLLTAEQIREADRHTITQEPIASIDLMERAADACYRWIAARYGTHRPFHIYVYNGNNGGDGLAIARMLHLNGFDVSVYEVYSDVSPSADFAENKKRLTEKGFHRYFLLREKKDLIPHSSEHIIVDALFGTGLSRIIEGRIADVIHHINLSGSEIISVDMPSGLFADRTSHLPGHAVVKATHTLTFQLYKKAFLMAENSEFTGEIHLLPIGLDESFIRSLSVHDYLLETEDIRQLIKKRRKFSHKGQYGHAAIVAGSYGKAGAAVLATLACVRSGAGLTTAIVPASVYPIIQTSVPEAMCITPPPAGSPSDFYLRPITDFVPEKFTVLGIGPGIGQEKTTHALLHSLLKGFKRPVVLDADALNLFSQDPDLLSLIPPQSVLTPHIGEFERLAGKAENDFHRLELLKSFARQHQVIMVLKGHFTCIATPQGQCYFNTSGNPSMAKGGSGDVLTGMITGWLAQGYAPLHAALIAVHLHGLAADKAIKTTDEHAVTATDLIHHSIALLQSF